MTDDLEQERLKARRKYLLAWVEVYEQANRYTPDLGMDDKLTTLLADLDAVEQQLLKPSKRGWLSE